MAEPVIIEALRTPIGKFKGALREQRPDELYAQVINALLEKSGLPIEQVEDVITGVVTQASEQGANVGRAAGLISNLPKTVPATTLNRACGSSQQAIHFAAQAVAAGDAYYVIAGGVECMTRVPMFSDAGGKGGFEERLAMISPLLRQKYDLIHQGESAERVAQAWDLTRKDLDELSYRSHIRAAVATRQNYFKNQIIPIEGLDKDANKISLTYDEGIRFNPELAKMMSLPPAFHPGGTITAGNSSQISDGAAALLIADEDVARMDGFTPRARFRARVAVGGDPTMQLIEVIPATKKALARAGLSIEDIDVFEVNEAFASVVLAWARELNADMEKVNPNGGAIAHGHPLGATGAILMTKLLHELERRDAQFGLQVMCIARGMATATIIERIY
jgi:acetyl-CoA C-acetyltransferase